MIDHWGHEVIVCPGCGVRVVPGQRYCSECGARLKVCGDCKRAYPWQGKLLCLVNGVTVKETATACMRWEDKHGVIS